MALTVSVPDHGVAAGTEDVAATVVALTRGSLEILNPRKRTPTQNKLKVKPEKAHHTGLEAHVMAQAVMDEVAMATVGVGEIIMATEAPLHLLV